MLSRNRGESQPICARKVAAAARHIKYAPGDAAWSQGLKSMKAHSERTPKKLSTVEQQVKKIVAELAGRKEEEVTNDAAFVAICGADSLDRGDW